MFGYIAITVIFSVIGMIISGRLRGKFSHYSRVPLRSGMSGAEIAETMLRHYNIRDVKIVEGQGFLTDHYNPLTKTVSLSSDVFHGRSVAAAAVAAHECGHAVQHATSYSMLQFRSAMVPVVNVAAGLQQYLLLFALGAFGVASNNMLLLVTIGVFAVTTLFSIVTLPVEFDASKRALAWLDQSGVARGVEYDGAKDALWWAAMTYVAAALSALVTLLYLLMRLNND
ncbi:MAG TPA: zinc metallopeptidase [Saprospiraceae bacterium]|mgnify:CR=1 FL=1|jgi:Zn-dependent membrane protease YugP|nr:zinc metallopeptidase [Saprospiraceae bacterium]HMP13698.1 zinc metallopeptidase [Saprospiraceae bacterium]